MRTNDWVGKRQSARQSVNMRGEVRYLDGRVPVGCKIIDISASGCAIELEDGSELPEDFDLFIQSRGETKICKVRRRNGKATGVAFLKSRHDDPLVMQSLIARVASLELRQAEPEGDDRRAVADPRRDEDRHFLTAVARLEERLTAQSAEMDELREALRALQARPVPVVEAPDHAPRQLEQDRAIAALKTEVADLRASLDAFKVAPPPVVATAAAPGTGVVESAAEPANAADIEAVAKQLASLRADLENSLANVPRERMLEFADGLGSLRAEVGALKEKMRERDSAPRREVGEPNTGADPALSAQVEELRAAVRTLILLVSSTLARRAAEAEPRQAA